MPHQQSGLPNTVWLTFVLALILFCPQKANAGQPPKTDSTTTTTFEITPRQGLQKLSNSVLDARPTTSQRFEFMLRQVNAEQVDGITQPELANLNNEPLQADVFVPYEALQSAESENELASGNESLAESIAKTPEEVFECAVEPLFEHALDENQYWKRRRCCPMRRLLHAYANRFDEQDVGIGHERLVFAPFGLDVARPHNNVRLRIDSVYGLNFPDRSEYFWATQGKGPKHAERSVDYQDFRLYFEAGNNTISTFFDLPLRVLDPEVNGNTAGLADVQTGVRTVLLNGKRWTIATLLKTSFKTGDFDRGLGVGHITMEPSILANYLWNEDTILHGQFEYHIPMGGDVKARGEVLRYGIGMSHVAYESDTWAIIPTFEVITRSYLRGTRTNPLGEKLRVDGETGIGVQPGVRFVLGPEGDLGLFEFGVSGEFRTNADILPESMLRLDFRWSY